MNLFRKIPQLNCLCKKEISPPKRGETWILDSSDESPWPTSNTYSVLILDVLNGWVRYAGLIFKDQRMKLDSFMSMYTRKGGGE